MAEFNVRGQWDAIQTNEFIAAFDIRSQRPDGSFVGTASYSDGTVRGSGFGLVQDDQFTFRVYWDNGNEGAYNGVFDGQGFLSGATFDVAHPGSFAGWNSSQAFGRS